MIVPELWARATEGSRPHSRRVGRGFGELEGREKCGCEGERSGYKNVKGITINDVNRA